MESEIHSWLEKILKVDIKDFTVKILGNSEKGDGYLGDIVFVDLKPLTTGSEYSLVLKCSKQSQTLREKAPIGEIFENEIYMYETVFPLFRKFQQENSIQNIFNSYPKCYGALQTENMEIIALENLRNKGYQLWDKKKPLTRKHINMVIEEYAKFHAISICMKEQQPLNFKKLISGLQNVQEQFVVAFDMDRLFGSNILEIYEILKGELPDEILEQWLKLKDQILYIFCDMLDEITGVKVVRHGDSWSNNFMFKHDLDREEFPTAVAILDWQIAYYSSPITDLSYFLYSCISSDEVEELNNILNYYYENLAKFCRNFSVNLEKIYPKNDFFQDWRKYCRYGVVLASLLYKICATEKEDVIDLSDAAEVDINAVFSYQSKNKEAIKKRAKNIVKYVVENKLV